MHTLYNIDIMQSACMHYTQENLRRNACLRSRQCDCQPSMTVRIVSPYCKFDGFGLLTVMGQKLDGMAVVLIVLISSTRY